MSQAKMSAIFYPYSLYIPHLQGEHPFFDTLPAHLAHAKCEYEALNAFVKEKKDLQSLTLSELYERSRTLHPAVRTRIRTLAGSCLSHALFFDLLSSSPQRPQGALLCAIEQAFGSYEGLLRAAERALPDYPESGWLWLACHRRFGGLRLLFYRDADFPDLMLYEPLACLDFWEHAYVCQYPNARAQYLADAFAFTDWTRAAQCDARLALGRGA
jgi:Fe-Mn family superoxide dismutase